MQFMLGITVHIWGQYGMKNMNRRFVSKEDIEGSEILANNALL